MYAIDFTSILVFHTILFAKRSYSIRHVFLKNDSWLHIKKEDGKELEEEVQPGEETIVIGVLDDKNEKSKQTSKVYSSHGQQSASSNTL